MLIDVCKMLFTCRKMKLAVGVSRSHATARPFGEIPGPKSNPVVGTLLNYLPLVGKYRFDTLHHNGREKYLEFGPIIREEIVPGTNIVWIYEPEDVQELFRREGRYPLRRSHLALEHYRRSKPHVYNTGGLLPTNGSEWARLRSIFQKGLSSPQAVRQYLPKVNEVVDEFIDFIDGKREEINHEDFLPTLSRVFLEMLGLVAFDYRLNSFSAAEMSENSRCTRLMSAAMTINSCILKTDNGMQLWKHFPTPIYTKLRNAHNFLDRVAVSLIREKQEKMMKTTCVEKSILETYLTSPDADWKDVVGMTADILLAGIDTTTFSTAFILYHLAKNPEKQRKLYEESRVLLPNPKAEVTPEVLHNGQYLKASVKESFRLNPISVGVGRILSEDAVFSNYLVPKGNVVVTQNQVTCRFEKFFQEPDKFVPERWLKERRNDEGVNPYLVLPFGHGPRTCIARRLAEQNIYTLLLKLFRSFQICWSGGNLDARSHLINKPDGPLLLNFTRRRL